MATIPVVDLAPFWQNKGIVVGEKPTPDQLRAASEIDKANQEFGFMAVKNFGISKEDVELYFEDARELFAMPIEAKNQFRKADEADIGYVSPDQPEIQHNGLQARKEAFKLRTETDFTGCPKAFRDSSSELFARLEEIKRRYCFAAALALGLDPKMVWEMHKTTDLTSIRYNHYAPFEIPPRREELVYRMGAHTDFGTQTFLLLKDGANGLEIQPRGLNDWVEVKVPDDVYCVVNIGDMWETMTNGRWQVTLLDSRATSQLLFIGKPFVIELCFGTKNTQLRIDTGACLAYAFFLLRKTYLILRFIMRSIACFLNPPYNVRIAPLPEFLQEGKISAYKPYVAGERFYRLLDKILQSTYVMEEKEPA